MQNSTEPQIKATDSSDICRIEVEGRQIIIVGTAHISKESTELVKQVIEEEKPNIICLELDETRLKSLTNQRAWESQNIIQVIKEKQLPSLIFSLILSSYQKKLSQKTGIKPGTEMLEAYLSAKDKNIKIALIDRDARITLKRAWKRTSFIKKGVLLSNIFASMFENPQINEESLSELRNKDVLSEMLKELAKSLPSVKEVLIDERDLYLSKSIINQTGDKIVVVVGAGHVSGIKEHIKNTGDINLKELEHIPASSLINSFAAFIIPTLIIGALFVIGITQGLNSVQDSLVYWFLVNGFFCSLGAIAALSHPVTILAGFIAAPFTSLTPVIGAGYVTALVQILMSPPSIKEIKSAGSDLYTLKKWWENKLLRVFLAFILPGIGSMVGTVAGGWQIIKNLKDVVPNTIF